MPADANAYGDIFGGWPMSLMDMGAGLIAARRSHGRAVTVAMDGMQFHLPVKVGDEVSVYGELRRVGRSSMIIADIGRAHVELQSLMLISYDVICLQIKYTT